MARTTVGTTTLAGQKVTIEAAPEGSWYLTVDGELLARDNSLEKAENRAKSKIAKARVRVEIPFFTAEGVRGVAYGLHAQNDDILTTIDGKAERLGGTGC